MPVFDAALDAGLNIIHVRHEAAAVHMADAWARLTGEVGAALVTGGPGHANAVPALYTALKSESPVVLLSGHAPIAELGKGAFQEMRQAEIAEPVCKGSWTVQAPGRLADNLARALRKAPPVSALSSESIRASWRIHTGVASGSSCHQALIRHEGTPGSPEGEMMNLPWPKRPDPPSSDRINARNDRVEPLSRSDAGLRLNERGDPPMSDAEIWMLSASICSWR